MLRFAVSTVLVATLIGLVAGAAFSQEPVSLAFKYAAGDQLEYDVTITGSGGLRAPDGQFSPAGLQGSLRVSMTVGEVQADGNARIQLRIPRADFQVNVAQERARLAYENGKVRWFSNGREQSPPDADLAQVPLLGIPLEFVAAPNGRVVDVVMPSIPNASKLQQMVPGLGAPQLQNMGEAIFPDTPIRVGESWRRSDQLTPLGATMPITVTSSRTLDSVTDEAGIKMARISGYSEARFRSNPVSISPGGSGGSMTVGVPDLRQTLTSTEFFDLGAGRLVRGDYDLSFMTRVSVGMQGQNQEAGIEARFHATVQAR
ncbi:MAG: hypothetical protein ACE149_03775 [Armatimonadota bacterium]